ncbi:MAG TPA: alpha/beta fold hydrolase [Pyrinomonadaceae bacterium]|jgi:predicted alpha/beta-fold hydrolase
MSQQVKLSNKTVERANQPAAATFLLREIACTLEAKPFRPHPLFVGGHAQTLASYAWPRHFGMRALRHDEQRLFEVEQGVKLLARCRWLENRHEHPTLIALHGLEGSSEARYMLGTAAKAIQKDFNTVRLNIRNCGNTEHLTPTLYNSGMSNDLLAVVNELIERDGLKNIFIVGFSMSGNLVLKLAGENGERLVGKIKGVCAVSPSIDLAACSAALERRDNRLYLTSFMRSLRRRMRQKQKLFPERYDTTDIHLVRTIRDFDNRYTSADAGYKDADDYYTRASSLPLIERIRIPTLIIQAQDDTFIPFHSFRDPSIAANPHVLLLAPEHGGHLGFLAAHTQDEDRFWAENRAVEFCKLVNEQMAD